MNNPLPIGIVLPGMQRWHRVGVTMYALHIGMLPILLASENEIITDDVPSTTLVIRCRVDGRENDLRKVADEINRHCSQWYVLPLDDYISETAAILSQFATAPCYPVSSAHQAFHKHLLRHHWNKFCAANPQLPLDIVEYAVYAKSEMVQSSIGFASASGPFIVKPDAYSGSVGVLLAADKIALQQYVSNCANILEAEAKNPEMAGIAIDRHVLVETAIERKTDLAGCAEFTAHYLSFSGVHHLLGIAEKTIHPHTYIETGHIFPSPSFPPDMYAVLDSCTTAILTELNVQNTISNWEFIITPSNRLAMVEGQLRPSGDHVMELMENAFNLSPYTILFEAYRVGKLNFSNAGATLTSMIFWPAPTIVLQKVFSVHLPDKLPSKVHISIDKDSLLNANTWEGPLSWYSRHISIICTATDANEGIKLCRELLQQCRLEGIDQNGEEAKTTLRI